NNTIGGTSAGARNVISGNALDGIVISDSGTTGNVVQGNYIGTDITGAVALANANDGVLIQAGASNNSIGGGPLHSSPASSGNAIKFNKGTGVAVLDTASTGNSIRGNSISANAALGIDLNGDGVTFNDLQDPDTGPNTLQNFPVFS